MANNIKNEDALVYGIDGNSYGGYIDGVAVEVTVYPSNTLQPLTIAAKNSGVNGLLAVNSEIDTNPANLISLTNSYHQTGINTNVCNAGVSENCARDLNTDRDLPIHTYIKNETEDSQYHFGTSLGETLDGSKSFQSYSNQTLYEPYSGLNFFSSDAVQHSGNSPLLYYSNPSYQKQFYGAFERKVFDNDQFLNGKDRLCGNINSNAYFDSKLSWFANSLQGQTIDCQMEGTIERSDNPVVRQSNENSMESTEENLEASISSKDKKRTRIKQGIAEQGEQIEEDCTGKHECSQCTYRGQSAAILKIHQRTHSGERPFQCHLCDYRAGQKHNVTKHILVHMNEKPYKCQFCQYRCAQKNNLIVHERTHTGVKPFACTYCEYKTVQKPNLVKHMYLHTNEKPFACEYCDYRCVQKTNLKKHVQKHVNDPTKRRDPSPSKTFSCSLCPYKCAYRLSLVKHEQTKHTMALAKMNYQPDNSLPPTLFAERNQSENLPTTIKSIPEDVIASLKDESVYAHYESASAKAV